MGHKTGNGRPPGLQKFEMAIKQKFVHPSVIIAEGNAAP